MEKKLIKVGLGKSGGRRFFLDKTRPANGVSRLPTQHTPNYLLSLMTICDSE